MLKRVLVVEDERTIAELFQYLLDAEGYEVITARNGLEALQILDEEPVDLILSDIMMPFMDGWQLCQELNNHPSYHNIKLVLMSAINPDIVKPNNSCNYAAFIKKPFDLDNLMETLKRQLVY